MERCVMCGSRELKLQGMDHRLEVGDVAFLTEVPAVVCEACGESYTELGPLERFELAACDWLTTRGYRTPEAVRFVRKALGLRAADLGELLDVTPETVSRWENGKMAVPVGTFALLGELVADRLEGRDATLKRLRALQAPVKAPRRAVRLELPEVG